MYTKASALQQWLPYMYQATAIQLHFLFIVEGMMYIKGTMHVGLASSDLSAIW